MSGLKVFHYANVIPSQSHQLPTPSRIHSTLFSFSLNAKPQIGWDSLLEGGNHKPHNGCDVMCWRDAGHTILKRYECVSAFHLKLCHFLKFALFLASDSSVSSAARRGNKHMRVHVRVCVCMRAKEKERVCCDRK